jgi:hypothetical protein
MIKFKIRPPDRVSYEGEEYHLVSHEGDTLVLACTGSTRPAPVCDLKVVRDRKHASR